MSHRLKIAVLRDRYPTRFITPKNSRHIIKPIWFLPANKIAQRFEGVTLLAPVRADLGHFHNRIPIVSSMPFVMNFESHLPRYFGGEKTSLFRFMTKRLVDPQCRRIISISEFAKHIFLHQHEGKPEIAVLRDKLEVVYPNIILPQARLEARKQNLPLRLLFVGSHFGRKGGAVAVRAAEIARMRKLPLHFDIVSELKVGRGVWSDPQRDDFYVPYFRLLEAENVTLNRGLPNNEVIPLLRESDFLILTTFSDTFGYSAIEAMGVGTPVIATSQGALPEFVWHERNGLMLPLEVADNGEWKHIGRSDKHSAAYAQLVRDEIERLAQKLIDSLIKYCEDPNLLLPMRRQARLTAEEKFDSSKISLHLDNLYERSFENQKAT